MHGRWKWPTHSPRFVEHEILEDFGPWCRPPPTPSPSPVSCPSPTRCSRTPPGDWLTWRRTLDGWGYNPLDQIDRGNVGELRMVWTRAVGAGSQQGTPLAYGGVLYMPNPRDVIQAIDAVTGDLLWEYRRARPERPRRPRRGRSVRSEAEHRHLCGDLIVSTSADDYAYALDAATGRLAWERQILDYRVNPVHQSEHGRRERGLLRRAGSREDYGCDGRRQWGRCPTTKVRSTQR